MRSLKALGENVESKHLVSIVKSKLPREINRKLEETKTGEWNMDNLRKSTHRLILAREKTEEDPMDEAYKDDQRSCQEVQMEYTTEGLFNKETKVKCFFCQKGHCPTSVRGTKEWKRERRK